MHLLKGEEKNFNSSGNKPSFEQDFNHWKKKIVIEDFHKRQNDRIDL